MATRWLGLILSLCVAAPALAQQTVGLTWTANSEADMAGYQVLRALTSCTQAVEGTTLLPLATLGLVTLYDDQTVPAGTRDVCYALKAFDQSNNFSELSNLAGKTFPLPLLAPPTAVTFAEATRRFTWQPNPQATATNLFVHKTGQGQACPADFYVCGPVTGTSLTLPVIPWSSQNDCWLTSVNADGAEGARQAVPCNVGARPAPVLIGHWDKKTDVPHDPKQNLKQYTLHALVNPKASLVGFAPVLVKNYTYFLYAASKGRCGDGAVLAGHGGALLCQPTPLVPSTWTALTLVYDGATLTLYRDGAVAMTGAMGPPADSTEALQIGGSKFNELCNCDLEVWLYDQAMTPTEIGALPVTPTPPVIRATSTVLAFSGRVSAPDPAPQTVTIENAGAGSLDWTVTAGQPWLTVTPASGQGTGTVTVSVARGTLPVGTFVGSLVVKAVGATDISIAVTFTIEKDVTPPQAPKELKLVARPTASTAVLAWVQPGDPPELHRIERLNQANGQWITIVTTDGADIDATVPLPSTGRRIFRACAITQGQALCNTKEGAWAQR